MPGKFQAPKQKSFNWKPLIIVLLLAAFIVAGVLLAPRIMQYFGKPEDTTQTQETTTAPTQTQETTTPPTETEPEETVPPTTLPEAVHVESTATITSTGDILMHSNCINSGWQSGGTYDYSSIFKYVSDYTSAADYMVANLETTLAGSDNGYEYSGYPKLNCPDSIVDAMKDAGFDMLLTANNHCYDTRAVGLKRTLEIIADRELQSLGTMTTADAPKYQVVEINNIKIGMICYTYATTGDNGLPAINGIPTNSEVEGMINTFTYSTLDAFYTEMEGYIADMKAEGAEAIMLYIHWGNEYELKENKNQNNIAQKMCDLGVDVIVGGHPHVVQPMELLTSSEDPEHTTVCLYSMGNAVSNQRLGNISYVKIPNTEDGVLFSVTFAKYTDGTVYLQSTELIPCWVNMHFSNGPREYNILPLDPETRDEWQTKYGMTTSQYNSAVSSYDRTMKIVGEGLSQCQEYLAQAKEDRDNAYLAEVGLYTYPEETTEVAETTGNAA